MDVDLEAVRAEYDRLDRLLGIDTRFVGLSFSRRMTKQYGVCTFRGAHPEQIRLAEFLRREPQQLLMTARHEYAHAAAALLTGRPHGHDAAWKTVCARIGCPGERLSKPCPAMLERQREREMSRAPRTFYVVECLNCHRQSRYQRRGKVVRALESGRGGCVCRACGARRFGLRIEQEGKGI